MVLSFTNCFSLDRWIWICSYNL